MGDPIGRGKSGHNAPPPSTFSLLNKLAKWRNVFAGWQLGTRPKGDPEGDAVRDHREVTLMMRAELNALVFLLTEKKKLFTAQEWTAQLGEEAAFLDQAMEKKFPGITTDQDGVHFGPMSVQTMRGWKP